MTTFKSRWLAVLLVSPVLCSVLCGCSRSDPAPPPPIPDYIKAQQDAMKKAKNVEKEIMQSDQRSRDKEDEASK